MLERLFHFIHWSDVSTLALTTIAIYIHYNDCAAIVALQYCRTVGDRKNFHFIFDCKRRCEHSSICENSSKHTHNFSPFFRSGFFLAFVLGFCVCFLFFFLFFFFAFLFRLCYRIRWGYFNNNLPQFSKWFGHLIGFELCYINGWLPASFCFYIVHFFMVILLLLVYVKLGQCLFRAYTLMPHKSHKFPFIRFTHFVAQIECLCVTKVL